ncbi:hypothetical protein HMPREF9306_01226 [Propionimicrobium lymphophilum ACS-093-V-SCH5]|uniref:SnoaL-like domain-containing protein n=1 Tax=Propionimicrobium lymphophilum ACS-093-V-SCH5 TaxID=883161 RepID=S2VZF7_9ACTN|nr:hypothetical protein [Propionimicrobium lymphophilum]EPD32918.1 hypothetical protein HMPREF9306_01226 [Propionimicrobium lymphophilum ACS-093-V-SCH5]
MSKAKALTALLLLAPIMLSGCSKDKPSEQTEVSVAPPSVTATPSTEGETPGQGEEGQNDGGWAQISRDERDQITDTISKFIQTRYTLDCKSYPTLCWNPADAIEYTTDSHRMWLEGLSAPDWEPQEVDEIIVNEYKAADESHKAALRHINSVTINPADHNQAFVDLSWAITMNSNQRKMPYTKENESRWTMGKVDGQWLISSESAPLPGD